MNRDAARALLAVLVVLAALVGTSRVFTDTSWWPSAAVAVVAAGAVAALAVLLRVGPLGALALQVLGLGAFVTVRFLPGWPPDPGTLTALLREAGRLVVEEPAPTEPTQPLVLVVALGAWIVTFLVHELLVRLQQPGLALVPAGVLWIVPLAMPQPPGATWPTAVPLLAAGLLLLLLEADPHGERSPMGAGLAVGAVVVAAAVLAPAVLPAYGEPAWLGLERGSPRGYQPIVDVGDRLTLPADRPVLRVTTDRRVYLRLAALETFDESTWRIGPPGAGTFSPEEAALAPAAQPIAPTAAILEGELVEVDVEVLDLENIYVPVPYQPVEVTGPAVDEMVWSSVGEFVATGELRRNEIGGELRTGVRDGLRYGVTAFVPDPDIDQLRAIDPAPEEVAPYLALPDGVEPLQAQAEEVYAEAGAETLVDRTLALQRWFTNGGGFEYSVTDIDPLRGPGALEEFVLGTRVGYCEYFATAMAVMLRATGIPARVAVGFLPGELAGTDGDRDVYEVRSGDAHAWVEVLFPGYGWIKFDPTPRADGSTLPPEADELDPLTPVAERDAELGQDASTADSDPVPDTPELPDGAAPAPGLLPGDVATSDAATGPRPWIVGIAVLALLAGAGVLASALRGRRGLRGPARARVLRAQERVLTEAARLGAPRRRSETVVEALGRWADEHRVDAGRARAFAGLTQQVAFGSRDTVAPDQAAEAERLADRLVDDLRRVATRGDRIIAPVRVPLQRSARVREQVTERARQLTRR